ncbi:MAG: hypothetical protein ACOX8Q_00125 [Christensenellales bacterium]|jgi:hypothetical protein
MSSRERYTIHFFIAATMIAVAYIMLYKAIGQGIFSHCDYDSYTRQAEAWWRGSASLPENISWLELAEYRGGYYVSFPPFPSAVQFLFYPIFGIKTPDNLINTLFALGAFVLIYRFLMRRGYSGFAASVFALLLTLGTNLFYLSVTGWVWFSAQTQGFFLSVLSVYLIYSQKKTAWYFSFLCLGLAVACRPFQIIYAPLLFYVLFENTEGKGFLHAFGCLKYVLPMIFAGICIGAYNYIRFGYVLEFGHNYLPEFENTQQFSISYIPGNFIEILKLPGIKNGSIVWPTFNGTLFFLVNPVYVMLGISFIKNQFGKKQFIYMLCVIAHFLATLSHKTMGGWQFGSRYLVDMIPFMLVIFAQDKSYKTGHSIKMMVLPAALCAFGIAVNISGAAWYYSWYTTMLI